MIKKNIIITAAVLSLCATAALAQKMHDWHQLEAAHKHIQEAIHEMENASRENHYDMDGHAAKGEALLRQAERELHEAVESAKRH